MASNGNALFNGPPIVSGAAVGTSLSVSDSTALAAFNTKGIQLGTRVFNIAVGAMFELSLSTASLVPDSVVAVLGIDGMRWLIRAGVESVTGPAVDNTDPSNPVVSKVATPTSDGLLNHSLFPFFPAVSSTVIGDANLTIHPFTEKRSLYVVAANVLTATRTLTVDNANPIARAILYISVEPNAHDLNINDITNGLIQTVPASSQAQVAIIYCATTVWGPNAIHYSNN